jgi:thioredoxin reductase
MIEHHIAIIGGGPAGMACALQLRRMGMKPVIFEKELPGSLLKMANLVENYLGFPEGIRGEDLYRLFDEQLGRFEVERIYKEVKKIFWEGERFLVEVDDDSYACSVLVLASGTIPKRALDIFWNDPVKNYFHYDISSIPRQGNLSIGIIGLGDAAFDYALNLNRQGHSVTIFGRSELIGANKALLDSFNRSNGIKLDLNHILVSVDELVEGKIRCRFRNNEQLVERTLDCLIFATGRDAALDFLDESVLDHFEDLKTNKRLYLAGDVKNGDFRQTSIATGDGIRVAMEIFQHESNSKNGA